MMKEMTIRDVQMVCLDIMKDVHKFCVEHDIKYSLSGGTLLGAIRHGGFIPWDDDMDIQMPFPDYQRFINSYYSEKGYKLYTKESSPIKIRIGRVCDNERTFVDQGGFPWICEDIGIWIDVIPVYGAPSNYKEMYSHLKKVNKLGKKVSWWRKKEVEWGTIKYYCTPRKFVRFVIKKICSYFISDNCLLDYSKELEKYDYDTSEYFFAAPKYGMGEWQPKSNMSSYILHPFEDTVFYVMSGFENNLRSLYGDSYMEIPPEKDRINHNYFRYYWRDK